MKKNNNPPGPEEILEAMDSCFNRENKYPTIKFGSFRKMIESVTSEYDDTEVSFAFILKVNEKQFELGTIGIKLIALHPDQTKIMLCDDSAAEMLFKTDPTITYVDGDEIKTLEGE